MMAFLMLAAAPLPAPLPAAAPPCRARDIAITTDGKDGDFNGMSHSGTMLVLHNRTARACSVPGLPRVVLLDARGRALAVERQVPVGMHPGPVIVPVRIAPRGTVGTPLRWVSGEVYDHSRCVDPAMVSVTVGGVAVRTRLAAHICGEAGKPATFEQPVLSAAAH